MPPEIVHFNDYELDLGRYELRRGDRVIKLEKNPMELLILLVENSGRLVTREEIIRRLWGEDVFVDTRHGINTAVHKLRAALRDDSEHPRILETVVGKGYRLIAATVPRLQANSDKVTEILEPSSDSASSGTAGWGRPADDSAEMRKDSAGRSQHFVGQVDLHALDSVPEFSVPAAEESKNSARSSRGWRPYAFKAAAVLLAVLGLLGIPRIRDLVLGSVTAKPVQSLAVLPFENLSGDSSKDYFADGFTDELTTDLAEQTRIRVVSRSSVERYKGSRKPLREMARELGVDAIVEGSVSISEQRIRITAQLIEAASDRHLWAHSYERDRKDLFLIQSEVASTIADLIHSRVENLGSTTGHAVSNRPRYTPETYELAMNCESLGSDFTDEGLKQRIQCYQRIIAIDPDCAAAYAKVASGYLALGLDNVPKARTAALRAVELDPSLPEGHQVLGRVKLSYDMDFSGAEGEFRQVLALNPNSGMAHIEYSDLLLAAGRPAEAVAEAEKSVELDPFVSHVWLGMTLFMAHQYDRAIAEEEVALKFYPQSERPIFIIGYSYEQKGMYKNAIAEYKKRLTNDDHGIFLAALGRALWLSGDTHGAAEVSYKIEHFPTTDFVWPYDAALFYAALGDKDHAFQWLERDAKAHDDWLLDLKVDPRLNPLRSDARFADFVKRAGLPQ